MKKTFTLLAAGIGLSLSANAQLANGSVAPNFTLKDLNGNTHTLYDYLNQGKTVVLDFSAAWCGPCWNYHNSHALRDLYQQHGPSGMSGVNANTTNDVMVFFIEGETTNTKQQLYGIGTTPPTSYANGTQGNWTTGTPYPILDTPGAVMQAIDQAWNITAFPTIYMVCRDRLVYNVGQQSAATIYNMIQQGCPNYAPSATTDAKMVTYNGANYFLNTITPQPSVRFQNYSASNNITSANIKVYQNSTLVSTTPWSGSLAPYGVQSVNLASFTANPFGPYRVEVEVTGDSKASNNGVDSAFKIYNATNSLALPYNEDFQASAAMPYRFGLNSKDEFMYYVFSSYPGTTPIPVIGANGSNTRAMLLNFYGIQKGNGDFTSIIGNFNTASQTSYALDFNWAYKGYPDASSDTIEVVVSTNDGASWTSVWKKTTATLKSGAADTTSKAYVPSAASDWGASSIDLSAYKNANTLVAFRSRSGYGNNLWIDNIKLRSGAATGVQQIIANGYVSLYPNPAKDKATLSFALTQASDVQVVVTDLTGRVLNTYNQGKMNAGSQKIEISTAALANGLYNISLQTAEGTHIERLTVVK